MENTATFSIVDSDLVLLFPNGQIATFSGQISDRQIAEQAFAFSGNPNFGSIILPDGTTYERPVVEEPVAEEVADAETV
jgi:hypothetical protein